MIKVKEKKILNLPLICSLRIKCYIFRWQTLKSLSLIIVFTLPCFSLKLFFRLCCKELYFPRVVSTGDAREMSILSDERRANCATLLVQTLECLLNAHPLSPPKRTLTLSHAHIHTCIETNALETNKQEETQARAT